MELADGKIEDMRIRCLLEIKDYEKTYTFGVGERRENPHYNFSLFIVKPKSDFEGGLEVSLTAIDGEMVLDGFTVHSTKEALITASSMSHQAELETARRYRGPYVNELDDDFADEFINYLDDRGINNAFAEYITAQSLHAEDQNYLYWLQVMKNFCLKKTPETKSDAPPEKK